MSYFIRRSQPRITTTFSSFLYKLVGNLSQSHPIIPSPTLFSCRHSIPFFSSRNGYSHGLSPTRARFWASQPAAAEPSTSDGLTVQQILANNWPILDENDSDWKSHAMAIAQSIHLIKRRLQWKKLKVRLDMLSAQLN
ncbi:peptide chain release factor 2-like protein, partial [Trifolium pratense]